jgi:hypothetical protein
MTTNYEFPSSTGSNDLLLVAVCALVLASQGCFALYLVYLLNDQWFDRGRRAIQGAARADEIHSDDMDFDAGPTNWCKKWRVM